MKELYNENHKTLMKLKTLEDGNTSTVHGLQN
jgi:hypothetical protein